MMHDQGKMGWEIHPQTYEVLAPDQLTQPIPSMDELRERKRDYSDEPIDSGHSLFNEPLISLSTLDIAHQAYYSRANATTGEPVPNVPEKLHLRRSVAETLAQINVSLSDPVFAEFFGGPVELYVEDAWRNPELQQRIFDEGVPRLLRRAGFSEEGMHKRRKEIIALPSVDPLHPSPHVTGAAVDVVLRYKQHGRQFIGEVQVPMGHTDGEVNSSIEPDYFERITVETSENKEAQRNRRAWYAIMSGAVFGVDTGLAVNPTEFWHWSIGDQLWARIRGKKAYYSIALAPNDVSKGHRY